MTSYGLTPRPEPGPDEMAALVVAIELLQRTAADVPVERAPVWRFSGRWFNAGPFALRRP